MRVLVVGGTGFVGSWVTRQLVEAGHAVTVVHRGRVTNDSLPRVVTSVVSTAPLSASEAYEAGLRVGEPEAVIHVVAMTEGDARAAVSALSGRTGRVVALSSGDVYRAYGRFIGLEPGPPDPLPLSPADSPLRTVLFPYRKAGSAPGSLEHDYEKILVETAFQSDPALPAVVLRLPKVYGQGGNADLSTVYGFADHPDWRWTHGYVENVAAAVLLAAAHPSAPGQVFNVGEEHTPTVAERLETLPRSAREPNPSAAYDFDQHLAYDTGPIRSALGYKELVSYDLGLSRTLGR